MLISHYINILVIKNFDPLGVVKGVVRFISISDPVLVVEGVVRFISILDPVLVKILKCANFEVNRILQDWMGDVCKEWLNIVHV